MRLARHTKMEHYPVFRTYVHSIVQAVQLQFCAAAGKGPGGHGLRRYIGRSLMVTWRGQ